MQGGYLSFLIPPQLADDSNLERKATILVGINLFFSVLGLLGATCAFLAGNEAQYFPWWTYFSGVCMFTLCIAWVRLQGTLQAPTIFCCAVITFRSIAFSIFTGHGYQCPIFYYTVIVPAIIFIILGTRPGVIATLLIYVQNAAFITWQQANPEALRAFNYTFPEAANVILPNCPVLFVGLFAYLFEQTSAQAIKRLEVVNAALQQSSSAKDQFLANMSHELRTPLHGIAAMAADLKELLPAITSHSPSTTPQTPQASVAESLSVLSDCTEHLLSLVSDILDYERIQRGQLELESVRFSVVDEARRAVAILSTKAHAAGLTLECRVDDVAHPERMGDPVRYRQVLFNLLGNAIKFTPEGGRVTLEMSTPRDGDDRIVRVEVVDTGIGLSLSEQRVLFRTFSQVDSSVRRKYGGSGLGLAISKKLVEAMGGEIGVSSALGVGSCFWFTTRLPAVSTGATPEQPQSLVDATEQPPQASLQGVKVLVAEDNAVNQKVAQRMLDALGCKTIAVDNGDAAVAVFQRESFDVVLMDCQMPLMDGFQATERIRELEASSPDSQTRRRRRVPIIALTASATVEYQRRCKMHGMDDFLAKPFKKEMLHRVLLKWAQK